MADSIENIEPCSEISLSKEHCPKITSSEEMVTKDGCNKRKKLIIAVTLSTIAVCFIGLGLGLGLGVGLGLDGAIEGKILYDS